MNRKLYSIVYSIPFEYDEEKQKQINLALDSFFERTWTPVDGIEGVMVCFGNDQLWTTKDGKHIMEKLKSISSDLRIFVMPRDPNEECLCHPEFFMPKIEPKIDRGEERLTALHVLEAFEKA